MSKLLTPSDTASGAAKVEKPAFWKTVTAGAAAGVAEITCMYPTDVVKTRQQLSTTRVTMVETAMSVLKTQGPLGFYRGIMPPILGEAPKRAWKFGMNDQFKGMIANVSPDGKLTVLGSAVAGSLSGISEAIVNCPFEVTKVKMQAPGSQFSSSFDCLQSILRSEGVRGLYAGAEPQMLRNGVWNGLYFGTIGLSTIQFPISENASKSEKLFYKFSVGVVGSSVGTIFNTPFDVVKSRSQQGEKYRNSFAAIAEIRSREGTGALYKGLGARLLRLGPGGGIMILAFDFVNDLLKDF